MYHTLYSFVFVASTNASTLLYIPIKCTTLIRMTGIFYAIFAFINYLRDAI